jgi:hypothetical protein
LGAMPVLFGVNTLSSASFGSLLDVHILFAMMLQKEQWIKLSLKKAV